MIYQCELDEFSIDINNWKEFIDKEYVDSSLYNIKNNIDSSISLLKYKTSDISKQQALDDSEQIILATDDNTEITSICVEKINDDNEGIVLTTDNDIPVASIEISNTDKDDSEVLEFNNENNTETYAQIGVIDNKKGLFVDNIYDLNGNPYPQFIFDSSNNILIINDKKYKMIPYIEET